MPHVAGRIVKKMIQTARRAGQEIAQRIPPGIRIAGVTVLAAGVIGLTGCVPVQNRGVYSSYDQPSVIVAPPPPPPYYYYYGGRRPPPPVIVAPPPYYYYRGRRLPPPVIVAPPPYYRGYHEDYRDHRRDYRDHRRDYRGERPHRFEPRPPPRRPYHRYER